MRTTGFVTLPITNDTSLELENITCIRVIVDETNTERVLINDVPVVERSEFLLPADGTVCKKVALHISFTPNLIPTANPVRRIYLQYRKILDC